MERKLLSQVLGEVDPELTVIPGGSYRHGKRRKAVKLSVMPEVEPVHLHKTNGEDWDNAKGVICQVCQKEVMKVLAYGSLGILKACSECIGTRRHLVEHKRRLVQVREVAGREIRLGRLTF